MVYNRKELALFFAYLKDHGYYRTKQRQLILQKFLALEGHVCIDEVYLAVRKQYPKIGYSTVGRALKLLQAAKLAAGVNFTGKRNRFEHEYAHQHHDHLICINCGKTIEFSNPELEKLQEKTIGRYHFHPIRHRLEIFGHCERCNNKGHLPV